MLTNEYDRRCFIDFDGEIHFVENMNPQFYEIEEMDGWTQIALLDHEQFVIDEYELHDNIDILRKKEATDER